MVLLYALDFFNLAELSLLLIGVDILFLCRLYTTVHCHNLLRHLIYGLLDHFESLLVDFFHLVELILMLLLHHVKHHCRVVCLVLFIGGFFFDFVGKTEFGSLAYRGP